MKGRRDEYLHSNDGGGDDDAVVYFGIALLYCQSVPDGVVGEGEKSGEPCMLKEAGEKCRVRS